MIIAVLGHLIRKTVERYEYSGDMQTLGHFAAFDIAV
jgi:hypothetical protein